MIELFNIAFSVLLLLAGLTISLLILGSLRWREQSGEGLVQVMVLGDAGRSPRMQYHCLSLIQQKFTVDFLAYGGMTKYIQCT